MTTKPMLILQLRPEDTIADSEYACILKYGQLEASATHRIRIEKQGIPEQLCIDDYAAIIVGGSPFDISTFADRKSAIQKKIESDFILSLLFIRLKPFISRPKPTVVYIRDAVPLLSESWLHALCQEASLAWVTAHLYGVRDEFLLGCNRINILSRFVLAAGH